MASGVTFVEATPQSAAARFDPEAIHLWRLPYAAQHGREPLVRILAVYLGVRASDVTLVETARGKPGVARRAEARIPARIEFNWSHSGELALVALSRRCPLGVDIERLGNNPRALEIARRFFDPGEAALLASLDPGARDRAFTGLWCAKEAVLKAAGEGLSFGLARLAFARGASADWELSSVDPALGKVGDWQLTGFDAAPGYRGALAWRGRARAIMAMQPAGVGPG